MPKFNISGAPYYDDYDSSKQYTQLLAIPGRVAQAREFTQIQTTMKDIIKSIGDSILRDGNIVEGCQVIVNNYLVGATTLSISADKDRVPIGVSNVYELVSVTSDSKTYTIGTNELSGDCYLLLENGLSYIKWNGTDNQPAIGSNYYVVYKHDLGSKPRSATVTSGKVYMNGMVLPVNETTIRISGEGTETIGVKLNEILITELEDNRLRDPAQGYDNFNQPGCHRIKTELVVVKDDPDSAIITTLIDGAISVEKYAPDYDVLTQTLARRTYDESGSYIVEGLKVRTEINSDDNTAFNVVVESGKAYVLGYELRIPAPRRLKLPRSTSYSSVKGVLLTYNPSIANYELSSAPYVKSIDVVKGSRSKVVKQSIDSNVGRVLLDELEGILITSVTQGGKSFTVGTSTSGDCYLQREGTRYYLKWNGTDNYPTLGVEYSVEYTYTYQFIDGQDYELVHNTNTDGHELHWIDSGNQPLDNTNFTVDYQQYLARKDIVYIDQYGNIDVILGTPGEYGFEVLPEAPVNTLALASVMSPPGGDVSENSNLRIDISNIGLTRFTMSDIHKLLDRIRTIEYDQTILSLNEEAKQYETSAKKRGIFTDSLIDLSKIDYYYNLHDGAALNPSLPIYDAAVELSSNISYLPVISNTYDSVYNESASTSKKYNRTATLSKIGESVVLAQMNATKSFLINPYSQFPQLPEISITPAVDVWIDDKIINVPVSRTETEIVSSSTRHVTVDSTWDWRGTTSSTSQDTTIGTKVSTITNESVIEENAIKYIRQREISVEGSQFPSNLDNIKCYFDGIETPLIATGSTAVGTIPNTVKSNSAGRFTAKFTIPKNVLTGIREVRLASENQIDGYENSAFALYQASGTSRTIQRTVTTLTTVLINRVTTVTTTNYIDPVGQTFVLDRMTMISGIDLYFEAKPEGTTPVTCDIREVVNGTITSTIYGHKTLSATEVKVSSDSRVATRFTFDDPVLLEENKEYAFVVRSTSPSYRIWVADLGGKDIITGDPVLTNPYLIGVMMSSSNNSSWTTHQTTDVKFRLVSDNYSTSSDIMFEEITGIEDFSRVYLLADTLVPNGTSISWSYSTDSGTSYRNISPYNIDVLDQMKSNILLKATLKRSNSTDLSPIVALDSVGCVLSSYDKNGYHISKNITGLDPYTHVDIILDTYIPSSTTLDVYVSTGGELIKASLDSNETRTLNYGWKEQTYRVDVLSATQCRLFIKMSSLYNYFTPSFRRIRMIMS